MTSRDIVSIFVTGARDGVTRVVRRLCVTSIIIVTTSLLLLAWSFLKTESDAAERSENFPSLRDIVNHSTGHRSIQ